MQGLAFFRGHEEARENLSASCRVNCDNYLELLSLRAKDLPQVKLKIDSPVSSFDHGKGLASLLTFKTKWCNGQWKYYPLIVWQRLLKVLNLRKTSIIYTVSSSDISKLEQFHISDIYLDCKGAKVLHIIAWMQIRCAQSQSCIYVQSV